MLYYYFLQRQNALAVACFVITFVNERLIACATRPVTEQISVLLGAYPLWLVVVTFYQNQIINYSYR